MMNTLPTHDVTTEKGLDAFLDEILGFVDDEETETPESTMGAEAEHYKVELEFRPIEMKASVTTKAA